MDESLSKFPLMSVAAIGYLLVGGFLAVTGKISYQDYLDSSAVILPGLGVVGGVRVIDKWRKQNNGDI